MYSHNKPPSGPIPMHSVPVVSLMSSPHGTPSAVQCISSPPFECSRHMAFDAHVPKLLTCPVMYMQILGNLYPHNPAKAHKAVSHFKEAAGRSDKDPEVWEMLGELLAPTDPSGLLQTVKPPCLAYIAVPV